MKNDVQLQTDVERQLRWEPSVRAEPIGVSVKNDVVELDGHVDNYFEKWAAERAAMRVSNAKAVASEIKSRCLHPQFERMKISLERP